MDLRTHSLPRTLSDVVFPNVKAKRQIEAFVAAEIDWVCLEGPTGTGKSEVARLLPTLRTTDIQPALDVNVYHGSGGMASFEGAMTFVFSNGFNSRDERCLIIDEVDQWRPDVAERFKKSLDELHRRGIRRPIICTTNRPRALDPPLRNRFLTIRWDGLPEDEVVTRAKAVLAQQGRSLPADELHQLVLRSRGSLRSLFWHLLPGAV